MCIRNHYLLTECSLSLEVERSCHEMLPLWLNSRVQITMVKEQRDM